MSHRVTFPKRWTRSPGLGVHNVIGPGAGKAGSNAVFRGLGMPKRLGAPASMGERKRIGPIVPVTS